MSNKTEQHAFLYSLWSGRLIVYEGKVYSGDDRRYSVFHDEKRKKRFMCSTEPAKETNSVVWLETRDDDLAIKILMDYHEDEMIKLYEKIENHRHKKHILMSILTDGIKIVEKVNT